MTAAEQLAEMAAEATLNLSHELTGSYDNDNLLSASAHQLREYRAVLRWFAEEVERSNAKNVNCGCDLCFRREFDAVLRELGIEREEK